MSSSRRSRKRPVSADPASAPGDGAGGPRNRLRGEERDAQLRAGLTPLQPGERPAALKIAAAVAATLAVLNVLFWAIGVDVQGEEPQLGGVLAFAVLMLIAAWGMWTGRYWAVLGFQALLATTILIAALSLLVAGNVLAVLLCAAIIGFGGWLFWKLVRVLGRMKVPTLSA